MSSPSTNNTVNTPNKNVSLSLKPKTDPKLRSCITHVAITYSSAPRPRDDFVLFPAPDIIENCAVDRRARARSVREELISDGLFPSQEKDKSKHENLAPLQRAARRRKQLAHSTIVHHSDGRAQKENVNLPPAPSPPRLASPDLDDMNEDLWSCCNWCETSVQSYIAANKQMQGRKLFLTKLRFTC